MINVIKHPLIQHKLFLMRDKNTRTKNFRQLSFEIAGMLGYEAMRDLPTKLYMVETPITTTQAPAIASNKKLALVSILRAGLAMSDAIAALVPAAKIGHIGIYRDHETKNAIEYFCKLPNDISEREIFLLDPMLATGASAKSAIDLLKEKGATKIKFVCIISAPEGIKTIQDAHPDVDIYTANIDEKLNEDAYIVPGLGDAGDRIFGTL